MARTLISIQQEAMYRQFKQSESAPMGKPSIQSGMQRQSDNKSIENILDELIKRQPREDNLLYIMSIESDKSKNKRGSDILEKLDEQKRYSITNRNSTEMIGEDRPGGSFGVVGVSAQNIRMPVQVQIHSSNAWNQKEEHSCDCYRTCLGKNCSCFNFLEQCMPTRCCNKCIEIKNQMIAEYIQQRQQEAMYSIYSQPIPYMQMQQQYSLQPQPMTYQTKQSMATVQIPTPIYPQQQLYQQQQPQPRQPEPVAKEQYQQPSTCACKKTRCLKMYCECFSNRGYCSPLCSCEDCLNKGESQARRKALAESVRELDKGCHCKKTKCDKKYCKCFSAGEKCTPYCTCENCLNMSEELRTIRKGSEEIEPEPMVVQPQPPEEKIPVVPVSHLPRDIQFDLPDFSNFNMNDT